MTTVVEPADSPCVWLSLTTTYKPPRWFSACEISMRLGFREDTRGVSALVGAVLLLGILVIALASYQAIIVPQQNAQTEFDHNQQVEDEMVELRNALLEARLDSRERATSVKLGTRYQSRTLAVNPPPATGTLQSTPQANFSVIDGDGEEELNLTGNQFIEYTPSYSEYRDAGTIRYENSLVYHDFADANVALSSQRLVRNGDILLLPNEPEIDEQGVDRVTYEPTRSNLRFKEITDPTIEIPTELDEDDWEELLENELDVIKDGTDGITVEDGFLTVEFTGERDVFFTPVPEQEDLGDEPDEPPQVEDRDPETVINPASPTDVRLTAVDIDSGNPTKIDLTFQKAEGDPVDLTAGRINVIVGLQNVADRVSRVEDDGTNIGGPWEVGDDFADLDESVQIGNDSTTITYVLDGSFNENQDFFVTTLEFEDTDGNIIRSTYIVSNEFDQT